MLDLQPEPVSLTDTLERGDNPYLVGLSDETLYNIAAKNKRQKRAQRRSAKPVARFENDFAVAMIPQKNGVETPLTIETELRELIKKIAEAGGRLPLLKLREGKLENYRPDKLLKSQNAQTLLKIGLLGKTRSGRTTTYWVKLSSN